MKIAVPTRENLVDDHFGHCAYYTIFEIENNEITNRSTLPAPAGCGCKSGVAAILQAEGVSLMLAGNMGEGAKKCFGISRHKSD
ncbi:MAG: NifB/NifX family molybdenum-iron cluster-binding protein [Bacteroidales bacterium]|nr:NifB/NifX family molybdenum-iron cluster-binding protein [Bacteroidales bacterium]